MSSSTKKKVSSHAAARASASSSTGGLVRKSVPTSSPAGTTTKKKTVTTATKVAFGSSTASPSTSVNGSVASAKATPSTGSGSKAKSTKKIVKKKVSAAESPTVASVGSPQATLSALQIESNDVISPIVASSPASPSKSSLKKPSGSAEYDPKQPTVRKSVSIEEPNSPRMRFFEVSAESYDAIDIIDGCYGEEAALSGQKSAAAQSPFAPRAAAVVDSAAANRAKIGSPLIQRASPYQAAVTPDDIRRTLQMKQATPASHSGSGGRPPSGRTPSPSVSRTNSSGAFTDILSQRSIAEEEDFDAVDSVDASPVHSWNADQFARNLQTEMTASELLSASSGDVDAHTDAAAADDAGVSLKPRDGGSSPLSVPAAAGDDDDVVVDTSDVSPDQLPAARAARASSEIRASRFLDLINVLRSSFGVDTDDIIYAHFTAWKLRALPHYAEDLPPAAALRRSRVEKQNSSSDSPIHDGINPAACTDRAAPRSTDGMESDVALPGNNVRICDTRVEMEDHRSPKDVFPSDATAISAITSCTGLSGFEEEDEDIDSAAAVATTITALTSRAGVTNVTDDDEEQEKEEEEVQQQEGEVGEEEGEEETEDADSWNAVASALTDLSIYDQTTVAGDAQSENNVPLNERNEDGIFALTPESSTDFQYKLQQTEAASSNSSSVAPQQEAKSALTRVFSTASSEYEFPATSRLPTFDDAVDADNGAAERDDSDMALDISGGEEKKAMQEEDVREIEYRDQVSSMDDGDDYGGSDGSFSEKEALSNESAGSGTEEEKGTSSASSQDGGSSQARKLTIPVRGTKKSTSMKNMKDALLAERAAAVMPRDPEPRKASKKKKKTKQKASPSAVNSESELSENKPSPYEQARVEIKSSLTPVSKQLVRSLDERDLEPDESPSMVDFQARYDCGQLDEDEEELMERVAREAMLAAQAVAHEEATQAQLQARDGQDMTRQQAAARAAETARKIEEIVAAAKEEAERVALEEMHRSGQNITPWGLTDAVMAPAAEDASGDEGEKARASGGIMSTESQDFSEVGIEGPGSVQEKYNKSLRRFESMLVDRVHGMCKNLLNNHVRLAPVRNIRAAFFVWKRCTKWFRKIDDSIPLCIRKLVVIHPELLWRVFCLYVSNKSLIPCSRPSQASKACRIDAESAARLSSGYTPSPRGSRCNTPMGSRVTSFTFSHTKTQLNFENGNDGMDQNEYADVIVNDDDGDGDGGSGNSPEDKIAQQATSDFALRRKTQFAASQLSLSPNGVVRSFSSTKSNSETSKFRKKMLDIDGLWSLLKDFNVCPHLFGKAKLKDLFDEMIQAQNEQQGLASRDEIEPPPPVPRRSYTSPDGRIQFKLTVFNASMVTDPTAKDRRSRSRSPAAAQVRQRQLTYGKKTAQLMAAKRSASAERSVHPDGVPPQPNRGFQRVGDCGSMDGSEVESLSTVFSFRSRSTSPGRSRSPSIVGGRAPRNTALAQMEQHLIEAACSSTNAAAYKVTNPLISFNTFVKLLWRIIASFMGAKLDDPKMDSVHEFLSHMTKRSSLAMNREIAKILPVIQYDSKRKLTAFK